MKTQLHDSGTLTIHSESTVESFALKHWFELWLDRKAVFSVETKSVVADPLPLRMSDGSTPSPMELDLLPHPAPQFDGGVES